MEHIGQQLQALRRRAGLSIRALAGKSGVTAAMISLTERDKTRPSLVTLQKLLHALGTSLADFTSGKRKPEAGPVYRRTAMPLVTDGRRSYTVIFPKTSSSKIEMLDELIQPSTKKPPWETLACDVAGTVISGRLVLEIAQKPAQQLGQGDAFYVPSGTRHRGFAHDAPVRLITVCSPARY